MATSKVAACDVCAKKSARWYCGADAAYLCDLCDAQVHTANSVARRHERLRITPSAAGVPKSSSKKTKHCSSPQVLPARKRTRSSRPHPHRAPKCSTAHHDEGSMQGLQHIQMPEHEINLEDFLVDPPQSEVSTDSSSLQPSEYSSGCSSLLSPQGDCNSPTSDDSSLAACFKGKAALTEFEAVVPTGIDIICYDADGNISMADDACFMPGDIPGLDAFDDCSLSFDLAHSLPTETPETPGTDHHAMGLKQWSPEMIKSERPMLRLNYEEIIAVWSDRGEPWVNPECNTPAIQVPSKLVMPVLVC